MSRHLTPDDVIDIFKSDLQPAILASQYDVAVSTIQKIHQRRAWCHVTAKIAPGQRQTHGGDRKSKRYTSSAQ